MANKLEEIPFTNNIGQTINPGDRVVIVTTGYSHRVHVRTGTYAGKVNGRVSVFVETDVFGYWGPGGNNLGWRKAERVGISGSYKKISRRTTLKRNRVFKIA